MSTSIPKKIELLAPAGNLDCLYTAVEFGADAIYLGGQAFSMRTALSNFDNEQLRIGVDYAHQRGVKVYYTLNTIPTNAEISQLESHIINAAKTGVDAFIVADLGVLSIIKKTAPEIEIHLSTQAGVMNYATANEFYRLGAKRIVLARELSLDDIRVIRENTPKELEIEAFVHGAICVSYAGRCLLSHYLTGRDANRGECAQPCRWEYYLMKNKQDGEYFPVIEQDNSSYILNSRDLCMIEHIKELADAGINSFKIEGRSKSDYYVAVITNAYRAAVDEYYKNPNEFRTPEWIIEEVNKVSHREYSKGFYFGYEPGQVTDYGGYIRNTEIVAIVEEEINNAVICRLKNKISTGERLEILEPGSPPRSFTVNRLADTDGYELDEVKATEVKFMIKDLNAGPRSIIRRYL